jgi:hypothetical protein
MHCLLGLQRDIEALAQKHFQKIPNALVVHRWKRVANLFFLISFYPKPCLLLSTRRCVLSLYCCRNGKTGSERRRTRLTHFLSDLWFKFLKGWQLTFLRQQLVLLLAIFCSLRNMGGRALQNLRRNSGLPDGVFRTKNPN